MGTIEVFMPQVWGATQGKITKWLVRVGDAVERDQPLFEISTDRVDAEIPSPHKGVVSQILHPRGTTVPVNTVVALIRDNRDFEKQLLSLGLELPEPSSPSANYVPFARHGDLLYLTGQLPQWNGERRFIGKLGRELGIEEGQQAARLCALNLLAHLRSALGDDLDRVVRCLRVAGYVNATPEFTGHSQVITGASDLFVQVLGDAGCHTGIAVGVSSLPYGCAVEVEAQFSVRAG